MLQVSAPAHEFQPRVVGRRPEVDLAKDVGREDVCEDGLGGLELQRILGKGLEGRVGGAQADVVLGDAEDDDGQRADREKDGTDAGRAYGEPEPEDCVC